MSFGDVLVILVVVFVFRSGVAARRRRRAVRGFLMSVMMLRVVMMRLVLAMAFRVVLAVSRSFALGAFARGRFVMMFLGSLLVS